MIGARSLFLTSALCLSLAAIGCTQHGNDAGSAPDVSTAAAPAGTATGHVHLTGDFSLEHDFVVDACVIGPAGDGLLSGYHMTAKDGDKSIDLLSIVVKNYAQDGSYAPADKTDEGQVASAMQSGVMGPLTLMVSQGDNPIPLSVMLKPGSKMSIKISDNGATGDAEFTDMETPITMADINPNSHAEPHGKKISGSVTWSCGKVEHIDPKMNDAVNGAFKKLIH